MGRGWGKWVGGGFATPDLHCSHLTTRGQSSPSETSEREQGGSLIIIKGGGILGFCFESLSLGLSSPFCFFCAENMRFSQNR